MRARRHLILSGFQCSALGLILCMAMISGAEQGVTAGNVGAIEGPDGGGVPGKEIILKNEQVEVALDGQFPRVFEYRLPSRPKLLGAIVTDRPTVELNGTIYTPAEFTVSSRAAPQQADYRLVFPQLPLALDVSFQLRGNELLMKLLRVEENGDFRLNSLYFPNHYLIRMPALTPGTMMYRGESWRGLRENARFSTIAEEDGEEYPRRVNWAAAYGSGVAATIANNVGFWKLATQFLGYSGRTNDFAIWNYGTASDFAIWNGSYHYRVRGKQQPLLESRTVVLTTDRNGDAKIDWMEAALWQRKFIREANPIYALPTYTYKILCAWWPKQKVYELIKSLPPGQEPAPDLDHLLSDGPVTTFEEALEIIKSVHNLTAGAPQIVYLVGWQYDGHDDGLPSFDKVNPAAGGREKLYWLAREAKKYNALISYHINLDDAFRHNPGFDPSVLALGLDGKPYIRGYYSGVLAGYRVLHTKEVESGYFHKRVQALLDTVPVEKTIQCDTLATPNVSFAPGDFIGMVEELAAVKEIFNWFAERGIDMGADNPYEGFYGTISYIFHWLAATDPFHVMMMHGKVYGGGGKPPEPVLGWIPTWGANNIQARPTKDYAGYSVSAFSDGYYLGGLLQLYLQSKELLFLGGEGNDYVARFADGTVSRYAKDGSTKAKYDSLLVQEGDVVIARGEDDRFIPLSDSEIRLYSVSGGERLWTLPAGWAGAEVSLSELGSGGAHEVEEFRIENNRLKLTMEPRRPYVLRRK